MRDFVCLVAFLNLQFLAMDDQCMIKGKLLGITKKEKYEEGKNKTTFLIEHQAQ